MRSVAIGDTGRRALVYGTRTHFYEGRGVRSVVHGVRTAAAARLPHHRPHQRLRRAARGVGPRDPGPHQRPHQPHRALPHRGRELRRPHRRLHPAAARPRPRGRRRPRRGRLRPVPRAALRDARRGADGRGPRRRPRRHVHLARGDRRPAERHGGPRHLARDQPRGRHLRRRRSTTPRSSRPAAPPPTAAAASSPPSSPRSERTP